MTGRYLFAIARGDARDLGDLPVDGQDGARVDAVEHRDLVALVCDVDLEEFGEDGLRANLERLDWVERVARAHDDVVRAAAGRATVVPMRLVTICTDDDSVRRRVDDLHDDLVAALDRVEGRSEWSVKAYAVRPTEPAASTTGPADEGGAAYLRRKRAEADQRQQSGRDQAAEAEAIHTALADRSVASRRLEPQDPQLSGRSEPMILNSAFLLPDDVASLFEDAVRELALQHPGTEILVQGPWPPYSFAVLA